MPSSPSSVCPGHRPALGTFSTISGGRERYLAISRTCVLYRSPIGRTSAAPSPNLVMYPQRSSLLFPVPMTKFGDGAADFLPIGDLYKTQVREMARYLSL